MLSCCCMHAPCGLDALFRCNIACMLGVCGCIYVLAHMWACECGRVTDYSYPHARTHARTCINARVFAVDTTGDRQSDAEFNHRNSQLGPDQRAVYDHLRVHIRATQAAARENAEPPVPLLMFVTGGAGTGKSFLIAQMSELIIRAHPSLATPVLLLAPTGVAAFNIGGSTLHTALRLPVERGRERSGSAARVQYKKLQQQQLIELATVFFSVRYLIIDEISMVSYSTFEHTHLRLCEIYKYVHGAASNCPPFGGLNIIAVGDFYQLPPVRVVRYINNYMHTSIMYKYASCHTLRICGPLIKTPCSFQPSR